MTGGREDDEDARSGGGDSRVDVVAERYLRRLHAGERPDRDDVLAAHPEIADALGRRLRVLEKLFRLRRSDLTSSVTPSSRIECPRCGQLIRLEMPVPREIACPNCGSSLSVKSGTIPGTARPLPETIGRFEVLAEVGRGAFGTVYRARDPDLRREVALKLPRGGVLATDEEERFLREARSAAALRHPGIIRVHEIGHHDALPFIVSDFIEGETLSTLMARVRPGFRRSAELVEQIARALDFAHGHGIVHRDVKPGNILVDAEGRPHIGDFGLARHREDVTVTMDGQVLGTPAYMSPEQAAGTTDDVDGRSDLFSLGVILYELLTGERPFRGSKGMLAYQILNEEPRPPRGLNENIPRDLETICMKALAKDRGRRYQSGLEIAEDLGRYLDGRPVRARPVSGAERALRWCRRNPVVAALLGTVAALLAAITLVSVLMTVDIAAERDRTNEQLARLRVGDGFDVVEKGDLTSSLLWFADAYRRDQGNPERREMHRLRFESALERCPKLVQVWFHDARPVHAEFDPEGRRVLMVVPGRVAVRDAESGESVLELPSHPTLTYPGFSPDGRRIITAVDETTARLWDVATGEPATPPLDHRWRINRAAFSGDGRFLAVTHYRCSSHVWSVETGAMLGAVSHAHENLHWFTGVSFDPVNAHRVLTSCTHGVARIFDWTSGEAVTPPMQHERVVTDASFGRDGRLVATADENYTVRVWDADDGREKTTSPGGKKLPRMRHERRRVRFATFSPDGGRIVTSDLSTVVVWSVETRRKLFEVTHNLGVPNAAFSPDGQLLVTASYDNTTRVWDAFTGREVFPPLYHGDALLLASFAPDNRRVLTVSYDRTARVWDLAGTEPEVDVLKHYGYVHRASFDRLGRRVATASLGYRAAVWDAGTGKLVWDNPAHLTGVVLAEFSPDGRHLLTVDQSGAFVRVLKAESGALVQSIPQPGRKVNHAVFSPDGSCLATADDDGARFWDPMTGERLPPEDPIHSLLGFIAFSPDGRLVATASEDGTARIWERRTGRAITPKLTHDTTINGEVVHVAFSPDGNRLVTASLDETAKIWDARTGDLLAPPLDHTSDVLYAEFSADGALIATACADGTARVWDALSGAPTTRLLESSRSSLVASARFGPDGRLVVTAGMDGAVRVWDARHGEQICPPFFHLDDATSAVFSPTGDTILTASTDRTACLWSLPRKRRPLDDMQLLAQVLSGRRIDASGGLVRLAAPEFRAALDEVRARYPEEFTASDREIRAWHHHRLRQCEEREQWSAAVYHLGCLIEYDPDDPRLYDFRTYAHGKLGNTLEAAADALKSTELRARRSGLIPAGQ